LISTHHSAQCATLEVIDEIWPHLCCWL